MSIYRKAVNSPVTTSLIFIAMMVFGIFSLINISLDRFPKFDANVVMVMSSYPGASAEDIETNLTKVLENSLNGVSDLKDMTSTSKENISLITLEFVEGVDIDVATNDVRDKLDMVNSVLPDGASLPVIFKFSADDMPIMIMAATANQSYQALDKILDEKVATPLARVSGVGTVSIAGAPQREIQVYCDPSTPFNPNVCDKENTGASKLIGRRLCLVLTKASPGAKRTPKVASATVMSFVL